MYGAVVGKDNSEMLDTLVHVGDQMFSAVKHFHPDLIRKLPSRRHQQSRRGETQQRTETNRDHGDQRGRSAGITGNFQKLYIYRFYIYNIKQRVSIQ